MTQYRFVTTWRVAAPIDKVWDALQCLSEWWPGMLPERCLTPEVSGVGSRYERATRGKLPYTLRYVITVTRYDPPRAMAYDSEGDLVGRGSYVLTAAGDRTEVVFTWDVVTTGRWLNRLAPLLKPLFAWNHNAVMTAGEKGLVRHLSAQAGGTAPTTQA
jgi:hypothetical protein